MKKINKIKSPDSICGYMYVSSLKTKTEIYKELRHLYCRREKNRALTDHYNLLLTERKEDNLPLFVNTNKVMQDLLTATEHEFEIDQEIRFYFEQLADIFIDEMRDKIKTTLNIEEALFDIAYGWLGLITEEMKGGHSLPKEKTFSI